MNLNPSVELLNYIKQTVNVLFNGKSNNPRETTVNCGNMYRIMYLLKLSRLMFLSGLSFVYRRMFVAVNSLYNIILDVCLSILILNPWQPV